MAKLTNTTPPVEVSVRVLDAFIVKSPNKFNVIPPVVLVEALVTEEPAFIVIEVALPILPTFKVLIPDVEAAPMLPPFITTLPKAVNVPPPVALLAKSNLPAVIVVVPFTVTVGVLPKAIPPVDVPVLFTVKLPSTVAVVSPNETAVVPEAMLFKTRLPIVVGLNVTVPPALTVIVEVAATVAVGIVPPLVA